MTCLVLDIQHAAPKLLLPLPLKQFRKPCANVLLSDSFATLGGNVLLSDSFAYE